MADYLKRIEDWRKFINNNIEEEPPSIDLLNELQIPHDKLSIKDVPDPENCTMNHLSCFAITFNAYNDKELHENLLSIQREYLYDGKHKNSLRHLRAILFFEQRAEHFVGPTNQEIYKKRLLKIVEDIRLLLQKNK